MTREQRDNLDAICCIQRRYSLTARTTMLICESVRIYG